MLDNNDLKQIRYEVAELFERINKLEQKVDRLINAENEDIIAINKEVEKIKEKLKILEIKIQEYAVSA